MSVLYNLCSIFVPSFRAIGAAEEGMWSLELGYVSLPITSTRSHRVVCGNMGKRQSQPGLDHV